MYQPFSSFIFLYNLHHSFLSLRFIFLKDIFHLLSVWAHDPWHDPWFLNAETRRHKHQQAEIVLSRAQSSRRLEKKIILQEENNQKDKEGKWHMRELPQNVTWKKYHINEAFQCNEYQRVWRGGGSGVLQCSLCICNHTVPVQLCEELTEKKSWPCCCLTKLLQYNVRHWVVATATVHSLNICTFVCR